MYFYFLKFQSNKDNESIENLWTVQTYKKFKLKMCCQCTNITNDNIIESKVEITIEYHVIEFSIDSLSVEFKEEKKNPYNSIKNFHGQYSCWCWGNQWQILSVSRASFKLQTI